MCVWAVGPCTAVREGDGSAQPMSVCGLEPKGPRLMFRGLEVRACVRACVKEKGWEQGRRAAPGRPGDGDRVREVRGD